MYIYIYIYVCADINIGVHTSMVRVDYARLARAALTVQSAQRKPACREKAAQSPPLMNKPHTSH